MSNFTGQKPGKQPQLKVDLSQATDIVCQGCGNKYFIPAARFKKVSRLAIGADRDAVFPIDVMVCTNCGEILRELLPDQLLDEYENEPEREG